jgi:hypothetical protein
MLAMAALICRPCTAHAPCFTPPASRAWCPAGDASANAFRSIARTIGGEPFKLFSVLVGVSASLAGALAAQAARRGCSSAWLARKLPLALPQVDPRPEVVAKDIYHAKPNRSANIVL